MIWDLLVEGDVDVEAARVALAGALGVSEADVAVVASIEDAPPPRSGATVCERRHIGGQFPTLLSIYAHGRQQGTQQGALALTQRLAQLLGRRCLVSDESANPYSMLLVGPGEEVRAVEIDPGRLDHDGEYWLSLDAG